ncbi:MAG: methylmalonyl Co-A mutase-associated GTPase MeaB, partial [Pseudomonadota bacterium]
MDQQDAAQKCVDQIVSGNRRALARAITLVESTNATHRTQAQDVLQRLPTGHQALRIGLSGTPGVGKSTFIENFGMMLVEKGLKVAVLAVDPSSSRSGGSILGDKTRMDLLSRHPLAFIRPSPSQSQLGGVARRTREATTLCEAAGFDVVLIETVGVGQSETMVADMSDLFILLMAPAGGDELQGVKRGIMEMADMILINKADGDLKPAATRTCADYAGALRMLRKRPQDPTDFPKARMVSALAQSGLEDAWTDMQTLAQWRKDQGIWDKARAHQAQFWFQEEVRHMVLSSLKTHERAGVLMANLSEAVAAGDTPPTLAAQQVVA